MDQQQQQHVKKGEAAKCVDRQNGTPGKSKAGKADGSPAGGALKKALEGAGGGNQRKHSSTAGRRAHALSSSSSCHARPWQEDVDKSCKATAAATADSSGGFTQRKVCHEADLPGSGLQWVVPNFNSQLGYPSAMYDAETGVLHLD
jgi:hypothetical protein